MKAVFALLLLCAVLIAADERFRRGDNKTFTPVDDPDHLLGCRRRLEQFNNEDNGFRIVIKAKAECVKAGNDTKGGNEKEDHEERANEFQASISSKTGPVFFVQTFVKNGNGNDGFQAALIFDKILEYNEVDNIPGFTPGVDHIVSNSSLFSKSQIYTTISVTNHTIDGTDGTDVNKVFSFTFNSLAGAFPGATKLTFTMDFTARTSKYGRKVLTPNSLKLTVTVDNFDITDPTTNGGYALGLLLVTKKNVRDTQDGHNEETEDRPDKPSKNNSVIPVNDNDNDPDKGFFSYDKTVFVGTFGDAVTDIVVSQIAAEGFDRNRFDVDFDGSASRLFFSVTNKSLNTIEWDPSLGGITNIALPSGAGILIPSFFFILAALLAKFL